MKNSASRKGVRGVVASLLVAACLAVVCGSALAAPGPKLVVEGPDGATTPTPKFSVTDTGFIGVGTNTPSHAINIIGTTNAQSQITTHYKATTNAGGGGFIGLHNNAAGGLPKKDDRLGYFYFGSKNGTNFLLGAGMAAKADEDWTVDVNGVAKTVGSYYVFETANNGAAARSEKMRLTSDGKIGVGTKTPTQKLEVNGGLRLNTATSKPLCNDTSGARGTLWYTINTIGADTLEICMKNASNIYEWRVIVN